MERHEILVDLDNERLDKFLASKLPDISRSKIQTLIAEDLVKIDGVIAKDVKTKVKIGQNIELFDKPKPMPDLTPAPDIKLDIVYEDRHLMVINKPAGLTVHPGHGNFSDTLVNGLIAYAQGKLSGIGGVERPGIVHRLDKDTSGLMMVAKTDKSHMLLSEQLAEREIKRVYWAFVWGVPQDNSGIVEGSIGRANNDRTKMAVVKSGGKEAKTSYQVLETYGDVISLIECRLQTGRTHQIRAHMSHLGHSLVGDQKYGDNARKIKRIKDPKLISFLSHFKRQALCAKKLSFTHPISEIPLEFEIDLPDDLQELQSLLENLE